MASSPAAQRAIPVSREPIECEILSLMYEGDAPLAVDPNLLAGRINHLCNLRGIRVVMLDGPQAWKSQSNGLAHSRVSERQLNTAGKTGLPGMVKPVTWMSTTRCAGAGGSGWRQKSSLGLRRTGCWWRAIRTRPGNRWA
jgi:hypothetical protein